MKTNFTGDYASSSMTINPVQGQFLLDFLNFIPMGEVMFDAMRDPDCDLEYFEHLCRFYCNLRKSLQDYTDEQYLLLKVKNEIWSPIRKTQEIPNRDSGFSDHTLWMVWETQKGGDRMTTVKPISIPAVVYAMLQELSDKNRKKPDQYLHELIKREYDKKKWANLYATDRKPNSRTIDRHEFHAGVRDAQSYGSTDADGT